MMKNILMILMICIMACSCAQNEDVIKRQSLDDVYFYLSNYYIVKDVDQIRLVSFKNVGKGEYDLKYVIGNNDNLWIIHSYNEENYLNNFFYDASSKINRITDSINLERKAKNYFPLHQRWDWVGKVPAVK